MAVEPTEAAAEKSAADGPDALVRRIREGDSRAEEELVERYRLGVEVILAQLTRDPSLAQDIHQETFALVLTKLRAGELRDPKALPGFLRSIARNLLIANRRKEARYSSLDQEPPVAGPDRGPQRSAEASQLQQLLASEEAGRVRQLLGELRFERDRGILVRYYLTGDSREEICRDLEVDPGLFNRALYRARQRLRELWERSERRLHLGEQRG
jgi:RNA polymerase sigma-70 factor (ECF subfamily)